ncbi:hypothetical protein Q8F55_004776 [Vanrija albida]|uniref:Uncharacterized protein n=1 Tax=Vanrija albida TaxID=181172 RepID=A0ABR3PZR2_9TREE
MSTPETPHTHSHDPPSIHGTPPGDDEPYITYGQFQRVLKLMRLQNAVPISVLVSLGTGLICALVIHPGMGEISLLHPTLLIPNNLLVGIYWGILYALQVAFSLLLSLAHSNETKEVLVHGVGMRFAAANWLNTGTFVCWTLQMFKTAQVILTINVLILLSIHITLIQYPPTWRHPLNALLVHGMTSLFLAILLDLHLLHGGSVALDWVIEHRRELGRYTWQSVGGLIAIHVPQIAWEVYSNSYALAIGATYSLFCLLFSTPRTNPGLPETAMSKPAPLVITTIIFIVLHPLAIVAAAVLHRQLERQGQIRLVEEAESAEERVRRAEQRAADLEAAHSGHDHAAPGSAPAAASAPARDPPTGDLIDV